MIIFSIIALDVLVWTILNSFLNQFRLYTCLLHITNNTNSKNFKAVPGWNENCKLLYLIAREKYKIWNNYGRIRYGDIYDDMKSSRSDFRHALKLCKLNEKKIKQAKLCNSFKDKSKKSFWKDINILKNNKTKTAISIDNENNLNKITEI